MPPQSRGASRRAANRQKEKEATLIEPSPPTTPQPAHTPPRPRLSPFRSKSFPNLHELSYLAVPASPLSGANLIGPPHSYKFRPFPPSPFPASPLLVPSPPPSTAKKTAGAADNDDTEDESNDDEEDDEGSEDAFERQFLSPPSSSSGEEDDYDDDENENGSESVNDQNSNTHLRKSGSFGSQATQSDARSSISRSRASLSAQSTRGGQSSRSLLSPGSRSHSFLGPSTFAPPFYNRPPTPLPPSPSLTSLLRPSLPFGNYPSRPATPDSSDTEATHNNSNAGASISGRSGAAASAVAASALTATTVPRASPKVPTYEYYGFVVYSGSSLAFIVYLLWSYLPTPMLHQLGIYYYPDRWWSLAIPSWLVICICYIYVALAAWNTGTLTLGLTSLECFVDKTAQVAIISVDGRIIRNGRFSSDSSNMPQHARREHSSKRSKRGKQRGGSRAHQNRDNNSATNGGSQGKSGSGILSTAMVYGREGIGVKRPKARPLPELDWKEVWSYGTDGVMDVPIGGVCEILYRSSSSSAPSEEGDDDETNEDDDEYDDDESGTANHNNANLEGFNGMMSTAAAWE